MGADGDGSCSIVWTRALELRLVELVRARDVLWRPQDNTNHNIHLKHRAYAEIARLLSPLAPHATALAVRARWVNIRSVYNHNVRKLARCSNYTPSWPLWKSCQFLDLRKAADPYAQDQASNEAEYTMEVDEHAPTTRSRRPRAPRPATTAADPGVSECRSVLRELTRSIRPLAMGASAGSYGWLGRHVACRLQAMRPRDATDATKRITELLCDTQAYTATT